MEQAKAMLNARNTPAGAFWEYVVAYQIVVVVIPAHSDYVDRIETNRGGYYRDFTTLLKAWRPITML